MNKFSERYLQAPHVDRKIGSAIESDATSNHCHRHRYLSVLREFISVMARGVQSN